MTETAQCGKCGAPVEVGALFCDRCGVDVTAPPGDEETVAATTGGSPAEAGPTRSTVRQMLREATLGEYEILDELGRGGMATVFRAHDISLDRKVAIKVMAAHLLEGEGMAERFKLEARTAAQLSHPHIIPIYAVKESASLLFFVMKYVEGRALDEIIARTGQLPIPMVKDILVKVGGALGYAHRRGVVHRDVKPGNIMIDEEGTPIVTDFGIAKVTESTGLTVTGTTIGTPSYMSPEQCEAKGVSGASDQYSLGIVAFQMLTGRLPFEGDSAVTVMYKHCHDDLPPLGDYRPDCPADVLETVTRMVAKDPAERWPSMEAAIQKLSLGSASEAYLDPIRRELVKAAKEGDFERIAELSTGGRSAAEAGSSAGPSAAGAAVATADDPGSWGGRRRLLAALATVVVVGGAGALAATQPWARGPETASLSGEGEGSGADAGVAPVSGGEPAGGGEGPTVSSPSDGGEGGVPPDGGSTGDDAAGSDGEPTATAPDDEESATRPGGVEPARLVVADVAVTGAPGRLQVGQTAQLGATVTDIDGNPIPPGTVEQCGTHWSPCGYAWSSSDEGVATVSPEGTVSAMGPGSVTISVNVGGETGSATVTVAEAAASAVSVSPTSLRMTVGDRESLTADAVEQSGESLTGRSVGWSSADPTVATVGPGGTVEAVGQGTTFVTAAVDGRTASAEVTVVLSARAAAERLVAEYALALEQADLAAARELFPNMPVAVEDAFEQLGSFRDLDVELVIEALDDRGDTASAILSGSYAFDDPRMGEQNIPAAVNAIFALGSDGRWRITGWEQLSRD